MRDGCENEVPAPWLPGASVRKGPRLGAYTDPLPVLEGGRPRPRRHGLLPLRGWVGPPPRPLPAPGGGGRPWACRRSSRVPACLPSAPNAVFSCGTPSLRWGHPHPGQPPAVTSAKACFQEGPVLRLWASADLGGMPATSHPGGADLGGPTTPTSALRGALSRAPGT